MSKFVFNRPLGDVSSPFGFFVCLEDPYNTATIVAGIQGLSNTINNDKQANIQREFEADESELSYLRQRELMNDQFAYAERMWQQNNEYNTPKAQMQRLKDAGLNPYLYAHGSDIGTGNSSAPASSPSAPGVSKASAPGWNNPNVPDFGSFLMQASSLKNDKMRSFADLVNAYPKILESVGGDTKKAEQILQSLSGFAGFNGDNSYQLALAETRKAKASARIEEIKSEIEEVFGFDNAKLLNSNLHKESIRLSQEISKLISEKEFNESNKKYIEEKIKSIASEIARNWAEASHFNASASQIVQLTPYLVRSASANADMDEMDMWEDRANFNMGSRARQWMQSEEGQMFGLAQEKADDNYEAGLLEKIIRGRDLRRRNGRSKRK